MNRNRDENIRYPNITNAQPLIEVVQCDEGPAKKVLKFIFDRVFLATDIDLAQQIADGVYGPKFDAITTEGDLVCSNYEYTYCINVVALQFDLIDFL